MNQLNDQMVCLSRLMLHTEVYNVAKTSQPKIVFIVICIKKVARLVAEGQIVLYC